MKNLEEQVKEDCNKKNLHRIEDITFHTSYILPIVGIIASSIFYPESRGPTGKFGDLPLKDSAPTYVVGVLGGIVSGILYMFTTYCRGHSRREC